MVDMTASKLLTCGTEQENSIFEDPNLSRAAANDHSRVCEKKTWKNCGKIPIATSQRPG